MMYLVSKALLLNIIYARWEFIKIIDDNYFQKSQSPKGLNSNSPGQSPGNTYRILYQPLWVD